MLHDPSHHTPPQAVEVKLGAPDRDVLRRLAGELAAHVNFSKRPAAAATSS